MEELSLGLSAWVDVLTSSTGPLAHLVGATHRADNCHSLMTPAIKNLPMPCSETLPGVSNLALQKYFVL